MEKIGVGIDGSRGAQAALEWAVAEARVRGAGLVVVHSWQQPTTALMSPYAALLADPATLAETACKTLADSLATVDLTDLAHEADLRIVQGPAAPALLEAAGRDLAGRRLAWATGRGFVASLGADPDPPAPGLGVRLLEVVIRVRLHAL
jgi:nucleotide-binding universal stress UspA family protein